MAVKRLGTNGRPVDAGREHWNSANGQNFLGYAEDTGERKRETAAPVIAPLVKKRGRPSMSKEQKAAAKLKRQEMKALSDQAAGDDGYGDNGEERVIVNIRIPRKIVEFFKSKGPGYQTKIVDVLQSFVDSYGAGAAK